MRLQQVFDLDSSRLAMTASASRSGSGAGAGGETYSSGALGSSGAFGAAARRGPIAFAAAPATKADPRRPSAPRAFRSPSRGPRAKHHRARPLQRVAVDDEARGAAGRRQQRRDDDVGAQAILGEGAAFNTSATRAPVRQDADAADPVAGAGFDGGRGLAAIGIGAQPLLRRRKGSGAPPRIASLPSPPRQAAASPPARPPCRTGAGHRAIEADERQRHRHQRAKTRCAREPR